MVIGVHMARCRSKTMQVIVQISVTPAKVPKLPNAKQPYNIKTKNLLDILENPLYAVQIVEVFSPFL